MNIECSKNQEISEKNEVHELSHEDCMLYLQNAGDSACLEKFTKHMLNLIAVQEADFRKCPLEGCDYIGTIDMRPSQDRLYCEK